MEEILHLRFAPVQNDMTELCPMADASSRKGGADFQAQRVVEIFTKLPSKDLAEAQALLKECKEGTRQQIDAG